MLVSCIEVNRVEPNYQHPEYENSLCGHDDEPCYRRTCGSRELKAMTALTVAMLAVKAIMPL